MTNYSFNEIDRFPSIIQEAPSRPYLWHLNPPIFVLVKLLHELLHLFSECGVWRVLENICTQYKWNLSGQYVWLRIISSFWTHHPCSSSGHLQLPEEVLQLLPLNIAITWDTDRPWWHVMQNTQCRCGHSVTESNRSQHGFGIDSNRSRLTVTRFSSSGSIV